MKSFFSTVFFFSLILVSSMIHTVSFTNYLFIQVITYILLAFSIGFTVELVLVTYRALKEGSINISFNITDFVLSFIVLIISASFLMNPRFNMLHDNYLYYIVLLVCYFYFKNWFYNNTPSAVTILYVIVAIGVIEIVYSTLQLLGLLPNLFGYNLGGSYGNPGDLANLLVFSYTISLGLFFFEKGRIVQVIFAVATLLHLFIIIVSQSRTAWIAGFISSIAIIYYFKFKHIKIKSYLVLKNRQILKLIAIFSVILFVGVMASYKIYQIKSTSADGRIFIWKLSQELIFEKPLLGHGYNSFTTAIRLKQISYFKNYPNDSENSLLAGEPMFAFNDYLQFAIEYGVITLLLLIFVIFRIFTFKKSSCTDSDISILQIVRIAVLSILICMLFSYPLQNATIVFCFITLLGIASSYDKQSIFELKLKRIVALPLSVLGIILMVILGLYSINSIENGLKWKEAYGKLEKDKKLCLKEYADLSGLITYDRSFMLNYGSILYEASEYEQCIKHYEKFGYLSINVDQFVMIGESYEKIGKYQKAEENYMNASLLIPHKFIPKYKLFKLYQLTHRENEALEIASKIRNLKIKVYSNEVKAIKTEVNEYLSKHSE